MDDFNKPIRPIKRSELNTMKIEPLADPYEVREKTQPTPLETPKNTLIFFYLQLINYLFSKLPSSLPEAATTLSLEPFLENLVFFKNLLIKLRDENPAHDLPFAEAFAQSWVLLNEHTTSLPIEHLDPQLIKTLISSVRLYPQNSEHSLGFYLSHYLSQNWFPAPFFELLKTLHEETFSKTKISMLHYWVGLIDRFLSNLKKGFI
ncbi:MAG: hypothetical protein FJZ63_00170 [Chlamydiae bacterium]|nr:hypothetical protein [Chlamydiota bacterium]